METKKDWFAARIMNLDKNPELLIEYGIEPSNTEIKDRETYRNAKKTQELFKNSETGEFDETKFNKFYDSIVEEYKALRNINLADTLLQNYNDAYERPAYDITTDKGHIGDFTITTSPVTNPLYLTKGIGAMNEWSEPTMSSREAAQKSKYFDTDTKTWSEKTVNEGGIIDLITGKPLAYAAWEDNGYHIDPLTKEIKEHTKGEYKTNEFGHYYAETVKNSDEALDKEFVTWSEVLTDDASPWNTIDLSDSDNINTSIPKTVIKGAGLVALTIAAPTLAPWIWGITTAVNFATSLPQLSKGIYSFFGGEPDTKLNTWDNYIRRFRTSQSDYARDNFWSTENILDLAIDSYMQLGQQRFIARIPEMFGSVKKGKEVADKIARVQALKLISKGEAPTAEMITALTKSTKAYQNIEKMLNKATKISTALSTAYLVTTSVDDVYNQAKKYGFDNQTAGIISLATYGFIGTLFRTDYFRGMLYGSKEEELRKSIKALTTQYLENNAKAISNEAASITTQVAKANFLKGLGNKVITFYKNHINDIKSGRFGIIDGAINEGTEEIMEEVAQDLSMGVVGKSWQSLKEILTGKEYNNKYKYLDTNPISRYITAGFGGALGGAIFKMADRLHFEKNAYKQWKELIGGDNSRIMKELIFYVSQGKKDMILDVSNKLRQKPFASTELSAFDGKPTQNVEESQNSLLFDLFDKTINDIDSFLTNNNLKIDYDEFGNIELIRGVRAAWINTVANNGKGLQDSLFEDYQSRIKELLDIESEITSLSTSLSDNASDAQKAEVVEQVNTLKKVKEFKLEELRKLVSGKDESYLGRLMLESNKNILDLITPTTKEALSKHMYNIEYDTLPNYLKNKVDTVFANNNNSSIVKSNYMSAWNTYKSISGNDSIKDNFKLIESKVNNHKFDISDDQLVESDFIRSILKTIGLNDTQSQILSTWLITGKIQKTLISQESRDIFDDDLFEYDDNGNLILKNIDLIKDSWNAIQQLKLQASDKIDQDPELINKYLEAKSKNKRLPELSDDEFTAYYFRNITQDQFNNIINKLDSFKLNDQLMEFNDPNDIIDINEELNELLNVITNNLQGESSNTLKDIVYYVNNLIKESDSLKDKFFLDSNTISKLKDIDKVLDFTMAIVTGSNTNYRTTINNVPFGANNFLNLYSKENDLDISLSELKEEATEGTLYELQSFKDKINQLRKKDSENKSEVINIEKKLEIKLMEDRIRAINDLFNNISDFTLFKDALSVALSDKGLNIDMFTITDEESFFNLNKQATDEDYINTSILYNNLLLTFETEFHKYFNKLEQSDKITLIKNCASYLNGRDEQSLTADTTSIQSSYLEGSLNNATIYQYLIASSIGRSSDILFAIKEESQSFNLIPFGTQQDIVTNIVKFCLNEHKNDIKLWIDAIPYDSDFNYLHQAVKIICSAGTGKTNAIIALSYNIIKRLNSSIKCTLAANTTDQLDSFNVINIKPNDQVMLISELLGYNEDTFRDKFSNGIIFIDECTNLSTDQIDKLHKLSTKYNTFIIYLGDTKQRGINGIDSCIMPYSIQLTESKRAFSNITRMNNLIFEKMSGQDIYANIRLSTVRFDNFQYYENDNVIEGIKFDAINTLTTEYIDNFCEKYLDNAKTLVVVTENQSNIDVALLTSKYPNIKFKDSIKEVQGKEWNYVITDLDITIDGSNLSSQKISEDFRDIYTLFTRHRNAIISLKNLILKNIERRGDEFSTENNHHILRSIDPPIYNKIIEDPSIRQNYINYKNKIWEGIILPKVTRVESLKPEDTPLPEPTIVLNIDNRTSLAQVATGFKLTQDYDPSFINSLELGDMNYDVVRNILYQALTCGDEDTRNTILMSLPDKLKNGKFKIKVFNTDNVKFENIGNLGRDDKWYPTGVHTFIVFSVDDKDIHLGMFHNHETSTLGGQNESATSKVFTSLRLNEDGSTKYYDIPWSQINISRSANIIDFQKIETNKGITNIRFDGTKLIAETTSGSDNSLHAISNISCTQAMYFTPVAAGTIKMYDILTELNTIKKLYKEIYNDGILNLFEGEIESISSLINYDASTDSWKARSVPNLSKKFVIFAELNIGKTIQNQNEYYKTLSDQYLVNLRKRTEQLNNIKTVLETGTDPEEQKKAIKDILKNRILFNSAPIALNHEYATEKDQVDNILTKINNVTSVTRNGERKLIYYNRAIREQISLVLQRSQTILDAIRDNNFVPSKNSSNPLAVISSDFITYTDSLILENLFNDEQLLRDFAEWAELSTSDITKIKNEFQQWCRSLVSKINTEEHIDDIFLNKNKNLFRYNSFKNLISSLYLNKEGIIDQFGNIANITSKDGTPINLVTKLNALGRLNRGNTLYEQLFPNTIIHSNLILDNKISVDNTIQELKDVNTSINMIIQTGRIFVYGDSNIKKEDVISNVLPETINNTEAAIKEVESIEETIEKPEPVEEVESTVELESNDSSNNFKISDETIDNILEELNEYAIAIDINIEDFKQSLRNNKWEAFIDSLSDDEMFRMTIKEIVNEHINNPC